MHIVQNPGVAPGSVELFVGAGPVDKLSWGSIYPDDRSLTFRSLPTNGGLFSVFRDSITKPGEPHDFIVPEQNDEFHIYIFNCTTKPVHVVIHLDDINLLSGKNTQDDIERGMGRGYLVDPNQYLCVPGLTNPDNPSQATGLKFCAADQSLQYKMNGEAGYRSNGVVSAIVSTVTFPGTYRAKPEPEIFRSAGGATRGVTRGVSFETHNMGTAPTGKLVSVDSATRNVQPSWLTTFGRPRLYYFHHDFVEANKIPLEEPQSANAVTPYSQPQLQHLGASQPSLLASMFSKMFAAPPQAPSVKRPAFCLTPKGEDPVKYQPNQPTSSQSSVFKRPYI